MGKGTVLGGPEDQLTAALEERSTVPAEEKQDGHTTYNFEARVKIQGEGQQLPSRLAGTDGDIAHIHSCGEAILAVSDSQPEVA